MQFIFEFYASDSAHLANYTDCLQPPDLKDSFVHNLLTKFVISYERV